MQQLNYLDNKIFILKEFLDGSIPSQEPASSFYLISLMEEHDATNVGDRGSSPLWDILSSRSLMDRHGTSNAGYAGSSPVGSIIAFLKCENWNFFIQVCRICTFYI